MATPLDLGLLNIFTPLFVFILVFTIVYGVLIKVKLFGSQPLNATIAFIVAMLTILMQEGQALINFMTPWFVIFLVIVIFIFIIFLFMGVKEESLIALVTTNGAVITTVITVIVIIFFLAISQIFGPLSIKSGLLGSIFNVKVLGVVFMLVVAAQIIRAISVNVK